MKGVIADRYEIEAHVGSGAMAEVFRARDLSLGEVIALKLLKQQVGPPSEAVERFRREVRLARRVTHPNVARVFDLVEASDGRLMLTMEFIEGVTLRQLLKDEGALGVARAARIGMDVCSGLSAVHAVGIVHRDLKPANILVENTGRVVLTDFGVARSWLDAMSACLGDVVGTPRYMAPEQAEGRAVGPRADLYALGVTLYEAVCGSGVPLAEAERRLNEADPAGTFAATVRRCLEPEPDARPASAHEVERALGTIVLAGEVAPGRRPPPASIDTLVLARANPSPPDSSPHPTLTSTPPATPLERKPRDFATGSVAVLPLRQLGRHDEVGQLAELVASEMVDTLCSARCMRVLSAGLMQPYQDSRDPLRIGRETGATEVVDGTIQVHSDQVLIAVRLVETAQGEQVWAQSFEASLDELLSIERTPAKRIAENVRARTLLHALGRGVAPEAMRIYQAARAARSEGVLSLGRALEVAPTFAPALAAYAVQCMEAWYIPIVHTPPEWGDQCDKAVAAALAGAAMLPESHVAAAQLAVGRGEGHAAVLALRCALDLAPTCPEALEMLGGLECDAGRPTPGLKRLELASRIDPARLGPRVRLAREAALAGRVTDAEQILASLTDVALSPQAFLLRLRIAAWRNDEAGLRAMISSSTGLSDRARHIELVARGLLGDATRDEVEEHIGGLLALPKDPRLAAGVLATALEMAMRTDRRDDALRHLRQLANTPAFMDVGWLRRCPLLAALQGTPEHAEALRSGALHAQSLLW